MTRPFLNIPPENILTRCPRCFLEPNEWSEYAEYFATKILDAGQAYKEVCLWKWRCGDLDTQISQFGHLRSIMSTGRLLKSEKYSVAGWMLSVMLESVPEVYIPEAAR